MTSEVAVMNRLGIALASDSASTVHMAGRSKYYHADKLFMLSNHEPIGVMVYNNSSLLGIPWETILKMFRAHLGRKRFDRVIDYANELIKYLCENEELFPSALQSNYFLQLIDGFFRGLNKDVARRVFMESLHLPAVKSLKAAQKRIEREIIMGELESWTAKPDIASTYFDPNLASAVVGEVMEGLNNKILEHFEGADPSLQQALQELARLIVRKDEILQESLSGIVIAGFGDKDHFPAMHEFEMGEIFLNKLKYRKLGDHLIGNIIGDLTRPASIIKPFAQSDMVSTFLHGVSPAYERCMLQEVIQMLVKVPADTIDGFPVRGRARKETYKAKALIASQAATKELKERLDAFRLQHQLAPILRSIEYLPKNELAHVASSLVNLSSFQKRISISEDETVGGPIDVAVISKGDGFVWIDRKHYFEPQLNRHFFRNRADEEGIAESKGDER
jgi:hypothetical protein